jgi:hypothetical protein
MTKRDRFSDLVRNRTLNRRPLKLITHQRDPRNLPGHCANFKKTLTTFRRARRKFPAEWLPEQEAVGQAIRLAGKSDQCCGKARRHEAVHPVHHAAVAWNEVA